MLAAEMLNVAEHFFNRGDFFNSPCFTFDSSVLLFNLVGRIHLLVTRRPFRKCDCDWPINDVNDPIGCWQVLVEDSVLFAGFLHQDKSLQQIDRILVCQ